MVTLPTEEKYQIIALQKIKIPPSLEGGYRGVIFFWNNER